MSAEQPIVGPGHTFGTVTDRISTMVLQRKTPFGWWLGFAAGVWKAGLLVFGWVPLVTGAVGWCPVYALLGVSTHRPGPRDGRR